MQNKVKYQYFPKKRHGKNWLWDDSRIGRGTGLVGIHTCRSATWFFIMRSPWAHFRVRIHRGRKEGETPRSDPQKHLSQSKTFRKRPRSFSYAPRRQKTKREIWPCLLSAGGNVRLEYVVCACAARGRFRGDGSPTFDFCCRAECARHSIFILPVCLWLGQP